MPVLSIQNEFKIINPDMYMELQNLNQQLEIKDSIIKYFIEYFSKDNYQFNYIMNWLANFFQNLNNSGICLVLVGDERTTDILVNNIIKPIFAYKEEYFNLVSTDVLDKNKEIHYKNKIFHHIKNITKSNKYFDKFIEDLISRKYFEPYQSIDNNEGFTNGELIITSDRENPYPALKNFYSKCVVFRVKNLDTILNKFGMEKITLLDSIQNDLGNFSNILAQLNWRCKKYYTIPSTEEKELLPDMKNGILLTTELDNKINEFIKMILRKELNYFSNVKLDNELYEELVYNFKKNMIAQPLLGKYFDMVNDDIIFTNKNSYFIDILKTKSDIFKETPSDELKYNGKKRYKFDPINHIDILDGI